jgi:N6-L-threonylcarbamoyladenine synthase
LSKSKNIISLGIETSCDETSIAVIKNGREILSNVINTQIDIHEQYGGVVPEIASRNHIDNISKVYKEAIKQADIKPADIDLVGVTYGPGLVGALLVGLSYGKALSYALDKPLIGVNHLQGHVAANYITHPKLEPPFLCLMMSGGNTQIIHVKDYTKFEVLGKTKDDAVGEAFDKVARVVGLGYPGGPKVDKLAKEGTPNIKLPKTHFQDSLDFSFSGIKTAIINLAHKNPDINKADLCASFEKAVSEMLIENLSKAIEQTGAKKVAIGGGVSASPYIRDALLNLENKYKNLKVYMPDMKLCTDNGAMIASAGYYNYIDGKISDLDINAVPNLNIDI